MADMPSTPPAPQPPEGAGRTTGWGAVPPQPPTPPAFTHTPVPGRPPVERKPPRRKAWLTHGATALVALIFGAAIGGHGESGGTADASGPAPAATVTKTAGDPKPAVTVTETAEETVTAKPKPVKKSGPASSFSGEGQYLVGEDIQPGTYRTAGPQQDSVIPDCYWARLKNASGEFDAIIANDNIQGQGRVTVNRGEYFKTTGCRTWEKVG